MITKYGDQPISSISVLRAPINGSSILVKVINGMSCRIKIRVEKNEVIVIDDVYTLKPQTETIDIPYNKQITLSKLINNTIKKRLRQDIQILCFSE